MLLAQSLDQDCHTELAQTHQTIFTVMGFITLNGVKFYNFLNYIVLYE